MARSRNFDPDKYYHVTYQRYVRRILKEGIKSGKEAGTSGMGFVYLTKGSLLPNRTTAGEQLRIIEVDPTGLDVEERFYVNYYTAEYVTSYVPPANLRLLRKSRKAPKIEEITVTKYAVSLEVVRQPDGSYETVQVRSEPWTETRVNTTYFT